MIKENTGIHQLMMVLTIGSLVLTLTACSGFGASPKTIQTTSTTSPTINTTPGNYTLSVDIANFAFSPATLVAKPGTTVTWTNKDSVSHTITTDTGLFDSKTIAPGGTFKYTFNTAGNYGYHCSIHTYMKGTVSVQ